MKQIIQHLASGETELIETPVPRSAPGHVTIQTSRSLISLGTERMLVEFGRANLLQKARQQPDKVRAVIEKAATDGILTTMDAVRSKLDVPLPLGYCNAGTVMETGTDGFTAGDRVVSNGPHAEVVNVPRNLVARVPDDVSFEAAAFTPVAAIGLQGIRLVAPELGETIVVIGLGLIGLLTVQMLVANGCRVIGIDFDARKAALAQTYGAEAIVLGDGVDPVSEVLVATGRKGADGVVIAASTSSAEPVGQAARMSRKRGRIVLVGVTGLKLDRSEFYEKELSFQVSCSYGPGRYDPDYEEGGQDYPYGFVRWTEQRNFDAVLQMMSRGTLLVDALVSRRFALADAAAAYDAVASGEPALGIVLEYPDATSAGSAATKKLRTVSFERGATSTPRDRTVESDGDTVALGVIGAGNYASRVLIPSIGRKGVRLHTLVSGGGLSATHHGRKHGFAHASNDSAAVLQNPEIDIVVVATRHDSHARFVCESLAAGKHVFVEKPLALDKEGLAGIEAAHARHAPGSAPLLMVGFNRRFAPLVATMKRLVDAVQEPKCMVCTVNAGAIPADSWVQNREIGGGRIIGEACHHIDLMRHLCGSRIVSLHADRIGAHPSQTVLDDKAVVTVRFEDGSLGTVLYFSNGGKAFPKERIEVFAGDGVLQLDNFRSLRGYGWSGFKRERQFRQDKGHRGCINAFIAAARHGHAAPIPPEELFEVSRAAIEAGESLR